MVVTSDELSLTTRFPLALHTVKFVLNPLFQNTVRFAKYCDVTFLLVFLASIITWHEASKSWDAYLFFVLLSLDECVYFYCNVMFK